MHKVVEPKILYFGTPVVLISTLNEDNSVNLAPMSSAWWLNQSCMLGMSSSSQTVANLLRERECVLNLPSSEIRVHIDEQILMTGEKNYIDPEKWSPLIMNFCEFFGLSPKLHPSRLAPVFGPSPASIRKSD